MMARRLRVALIGAALMTSIAWLAGPAPLYAAGKSDIDAVTQSEISEIRNAFKDIGLRQANVELGEDGRISLVGEYEDRDEVETAWEIVDGIRRTWEGKPLSDREFYLAGSCGPAAADDLLAQSGHAWREPAAPNPKTP